MSQCFAVITQFALMIDPEQFCALLTMMATAQGPESAYSPLMIGAALPGTVTAGSASAASPPAIRMRRRNAVMRMCSPSRVWSALIEPMAPRNYDRAKAFTVRIRAGPPDFRPAEAHSPFRGIFQAPCGPMGTNNTARTVVITLLSTALAMMATPAAMADEPKVLYLTFDDGTGTDTETVLDVLQGFHAKATFFALGENVTRNPAPAKRALAEGHVVANHTWSHKDLTTLDDAEFDAEVDKGTEAIRSIGSPSNCLRPPYGAVNDRVNQKIKDKGLIRKLWNVDTEDWTKPGADVIAKRIVDSPEGSVVLMHDGPTDRGQTVEALKIALPQLVQQGYEFVTLPPC
ncbi:polysaccharide deacetylase family protein [Pseudonocardiaceae bacterium YIM PH 21723]|nr:polysaccharide deacetylase family protein [Pseudonocardiaceae bacterium YIM PH 21723]